MGCSAKPRARKNVPRGNLPQLRPQLGSPTRKIVNMYVLTAGTESLYGRTMKPGRRQHNTAPWHGRMWEREGQQPHRIIRHCKILRRAKNHILFHCKKLLGHRLQPVCRLSAMNAGMRAALAFNAMNAKTVDRAIRHVHQPPTRCQVNDIRWRLLH